MQDAEHGERKRKKKRKRNKYSGKRKGCSSRQSDRQNRVRKRKEKRERRKKKPTIAALARQAARQVGEKGSCRQKRPAVKETSRDYTI